MKKLLLSFLALLPYVFLHSQNAPTDTLRKDALNIFMETTDYIKKEIPYVNYVRDIKDADVYIINTYQRTGSGGTEYSYFFVGQRSFAGMKDTLSFSSMPSATQDEIRNSQVKTLKLGLMRYVARTPLSKYMSIAFTEPLSETVSTDKWNNWVFRTSVNGYLNGEQSYKSTYLSGDISASQVTKDWKINLRGRYNVENNVYVIDNEEISSDNTNKYFRALLVRSISDHWSYGGTVEVGSSSYVNERFSKRFMPGIEYDVFPYSQSTRRQLRLLYSAGYSHVNYMDSTIYDKINEGHFMHSFEAAYEVVQKWGTIEVNLDYRNYLHDWSMNNLSLFSYINLRIFKGLSVNFGGGASIVHDQLGLVKSGATREEILLRRKEIASSYNYFTSFGLSWTFGSIYNNVVNPRFGNSSGGGMMISF